MFPRYTFLWYRLVLWWFFFFFFKKIYFTFLIITNELLLNVFCLFCYSFADSLLAIYFYRRNVLKYRDVIFFFYRIDQPYFHLCFTFLGLFQNGRVYMPRCLGSLGEFVSIVLSKISSEFIMCTLKLGSYISIYPHTVLHVMETNSWACDPQRVVS